jgi:YidC/Oxa1 family membrane protein insertase
VVKVTPYSLITRARNMDKEAFLILHEGPLGVFNKELKEVSYSDLMDTPLQSFKQVSGWFGITDKYWLSAFIPDQANGMDVAFKYTLKDGKHRFQTDMIAQPIDVAPYDTVTYTQNLFVGAKKLTLLESYEKSLGTPLFDRSVDFGWLYFITHPLFKVLTILHALVGNFGVAILLLTVVVKLILFPLANKSYKSMYHLKRLQPQLLEIKERYSHDRTMLNREMMALYQDQKVNPMSGCLPIIIQIPVFFALYKVLFITIEMRHAPFFGWVKDLSVLDPTTIFNLFGLIPWDPPSFLSIGVWPILMGVTMYFQQKLNPQPADPIQAKVMKLLPPFFVLIMASFPAGLVIYWTWNNFLSILQQWVITSRLKRQMGGE